MGFGSRGDFAMQHCSVGVMSYLSEDTVETSGPVLALPLFAKACWGMKTSCGLSYRSMPALL